MQVITHMRTLQSCLTNILGDIETQLTGIQQLARKANLTSTLRSCQRARHKLSGLTDQLQTDLDESGDEIRQAQNNVGVTKCILVK